MLPRRIGILRLASHLLHLLCLFAAFAAALSLRFSSGLFAIRDQPHLPSYAAYLFLAAAFWSLFSRFYRMDELLWQGEKLGAWWGAAWRSTVSSLAAVSLSAFFYRGYSFSRLMVAMFWALHIGFVLLSGTLLSRLRSRLARETAARRLPLVVIGDNPFARDVVERLQDRKSVV